MKKTILFFVFLNISVLAFASFHVSFARIQTSDASIKYFLSEDFSDEIDTTKYRSMEGNARIYVSFSSSTKELKGIRCVRYDDNGTRGIVESVELISIDGKGRFFFELPYNTEFNEISIEPLVSNKTISITMSATCDGTEINDGNWFITTKGKEPLGNGLITLDSSTQYSVSYQFDSSKYYYVSSSPDKLLAVDDSQGNKGDTTGTVVFSLINATEDENYSVLLKQFVSLEFDKSTLRKITSIHRVSSGEELDIKNISSYRFKNGESLVITMDINSVLDGPGVVIDSSLYSGTVRQTTITIPEDNVSSVLYLHSVERASKDVNITWMIEDGVVSIPNIAISCGDDIREYRSGKKTDSLFMLDGDVLFIDIKKPSDRTTVSVKIDGVVFDDLSEGFSGSYLFGNIDSITITVKNGYRFNSSLIDNGKHLKVSYLWGSTTIKDGQFLPLGSEIDLIVDCPYEYDADNLHLVYPDSNKYGLLRGKIEISLQTGIEDFLVSEKAADGYFIDPSLFIVEYGKVEFFKENGERIKEKSFIRYDNSIKFKATANPGYVLNYVIDGIPANNPEGKVPNNEVSVSAFLDSIEFVPDENRLVMLPQPEVGGVVKYKDSTGQYISENYYEGKKNTTITAEFKADPYFKPTVQIKQYTITDSTDTQEFPIEEAFYEINKPGLMIALCGSWNDYLRIEAYSSKGEKVIAYSNEKKASNITETTRTDSKESTNYTVKNEGDDRIIVLNEKISRANDYSLFVSGYSLKSTELLEISVIYSINGQQLGNVFYSKDSSTKITVSSLLSQNDLRDASEVVIRLRIVDGFVYAPDNTDNVSVLVSRTNTGGTTIESGEFIASNEKILLEVTPLDGYYIEADRKKVEMFSKEIAGSDLKKTLAGISVKPFIRIGLVKEDEFGTYSYYLNGKEVDGSNVDCREDDIFEVEFRVRSGLAIKRTGLQIIFGSSTRCVKTFKGKDLMELHNSSFSFERLGIEIE